LFPTRTQAPQDSRSLNSVCATQAPVGRRCGSAISGWRQDTPKGAPSRGHRKGISWLFTVDLISVILTVKLATRIGDHWDRVAGLDQGARGGHFSRVVGSRSLFEGGFHWIFRAHDDSLDCRMGPFHGAPRMHHRGREVLFLPLAEKYFFEYSTRDQSPLRSILSKSKNCRPGVPHARHAATASCAYMYALVRARQCERARLALPSFLSPS
jgi:hypothetical protein